jgi:antitoxin component YwqK of YwqJK toxin-antitoxin module
MKRICLFLILFTASCHHSTPTNALSIIQIQDRNGLTETISNPDRLTAFEAADFLASQPYKKVMRVYKADGKNRSKITTYHPNGTIWQYLEAEEMRAHGAYREWFPNGQLKIEATLIGGTADVSAGTQEDWVFDSVSYVWDEKGHLVAQIPYEKGMLEGTSIYYYPNGQISREISFVRNNMEGDVTEFGEDGTLKSKAQYKAGLRHGESRGVFRDGQLAWSEEYANGLLNSGAYYNSQNQLVSEVINGGGFQALYDNKALTLIEYRVGKPDGFVQKFTPNGELHRSFFIKNGKKQGEEIEYFLSSELEVKKNKSTPKLSLVWHESMIHGCVKTWYNNGQLQSQREYSRNQRSGPSLAWYRNGQLMMLEEYEEEKVTSGQYYKPNKSEPVSTIHNGNGLATMYDETGVFLRKITYQKGKPVDPEN